MKRLLPVAAVLLVVFFFIVVVLALPAGAAVVERTFIVSQVNLRHLGKDTAVVLVNEQFPGPVIDVTEGDHVVVHVVNKSPHGVTIHWHGIKQHLTCWADGPGMITQCPISANNTFTYRFHVINQEGTLWWHAHIACLRATVHGAFVIRPKHGPTMYPFPMPDKEVPIIIGEWWHMDFYQLEKKVAINHNDDYPLGAVINGKLGDLYNNSGVVEENYIMNVEYGNIYLLRMVNVALYSEYIFKIAGHRFTVVSADASYTKPYTTDTIVIAPGETMDIIMVADAPPGRYYMVALAIQPPKPDTQIPMFITRGLLEYNSSRKVSLRQSSDDNIPMPKMPDQHDLLLSFYFRGNLTSLPHSHLPQVPSHVDEHMFVTLSLGSICKNHRSSCKREGDSKETMILATMNNASFHLPATTSLLEAHFYNKLDNINIQQLPSRPPTMFDFTNPTLISSSGSLEQKLEPTKPRAVTVRRFKYNTTIDVVFQSTSMMQSDSNPMHLHGHNFFVLAQGLGNYNTGKDMKRYNLVDPPLRNIVLVPALGWAAIRFTADNPGVWFMHCHYEFHVVMGMATVFIVEDGLTLNTSLPSPPLDLPKCEHHKTSRTGRSDM